MKATKKVFGALTLSAALALGTMAPAFAADIDNAPEIIGGDDQTQEFGDGTSGTTLNAADTTVHVVAEVGQLSACVPVKLSVVASTTGGNLIGTPTGDVTDTANATWDTTNKKWTFKGYRIENTSANIPIKVVDVKAAEVDASKWVYSEAALTGASSPTAAVGDINLQVKQNGTGAAVNIQKSATNLGWSIPVKSDDSSAAKNAVGLKLEGTTSWLKAPNGIDTYSPDGEVTLTYTIAIDA